MDPIVLGIIIMALLAVGAALYMRVLYRSLRRMYAANDDKLPANIQWALLGSSFCLVGPPLFFMGYLITLL